MDGVVSFSQYIFCGNGAGNERLITLIGETHFEYFKCDKPSITVSDYYRERLDKNPLCKIMLEYNQDDVKSSLPISNWNNCKLLQETFISLKDDKNVIPFDRRPEFLTRELQGILYSKEYDTYIKGKSINVLFINPFYKFFKVDPTLSPAALKRKKTSIPPPELHSSIHNYEQQIVYDYLIDFYMDKMIGYFYYIKTGIKLKTLSQDEIRNNLRAAWAYVADLFILQEILKKGDVTEYIIMIGDAHRQNIEVFFAELNKQSNGKLFVQLPSTRQTEKNKEDCIKIYDTHVF